MARFAQVDQTSICRAVTVGPAVLTGLIAFELADDSPVGIGWTHAADGLWSAPAPPEVPAVPSVEEQIADLQARLTALSEQTAEATP